MVTNLLDYAMAPRIVFWQPPVPNVLAPVPNVLILFGDFCTVKKQFYAEPKIRTSFLV